MLGLGLETASAQLEVLLELVCEQLQLTETQYETATRSYQAVGEWLDKPDSALAKLSPQIFAQGSMALRTTNKPRTREEFDVDLVCLLDIGPDFLGPDGAYTAVLERLKASGVYAPMVRPKDRCIRLDYAGQFHLDVIPACPLPRTDVPWGEFAMVIPDQARRMWIPSNPNGYAEWFKARAVVLQERVAASVRPLPPNNGLADKTVLHRVVQLAKRRRDVHFDGDKRCPSSILLTTINAMLYRGGESIVESIGSILDELVSRRPQPGTHEPPRVDNPTNPNENLAWQWREDPRNFAAFATFVFDYRQGLDRLRAARGLPEVAAILQELFDPTNGAIIREAVSAYADRLQASREKRQIGTAPSISGLITAGSSPTFRPLPRNTFYGE